MSSETTRRRGADLEHAILRAAAAELLDTGVAGFTMERVAARAGTNKNAIYRRWRNRAELGVAAYQAMFATEPTIPDTGRLRTDVLELLRHINAFMSSPQGTVVSGLLAIAAEDPRLGAQLRQHLVDTSDDTWLTMLRRAHDRGEVTAEAVRPRVATVPMALLRNE
ncbi:MAG: TetR/AcrR family transcriptional regulator, partial [Stackebrandtia sp.]